MSDIDSFEIKKGRAISGPAVMPLLPLMLMSGFIVVYCELFTLLFLSTASQPVAVNYRLTTGLAFSIF
jgi:hypothetical protein